MSEQKPSSQDGAFSDLLRIFAVVLLGALAIGKITDLSGRRPPPERDRAVAAGIQLESRLWMDPLEAARNDLAANKAEHATNTSDFGGQLAAALCGKNLDQCDTSTSEPRLKILATFLDGGLYAESVESRRRTRYAVLSGLGVSNYKPRDAQHISYLNFSGDWRYYDPPVGRVMSQSERKLPDLIPYEWFELEPKANQTSPTNRTKTVLVLWLDEAAFARAPLKKMTILNNIFNYAAMQSVYATSLPDMDHVRDADRASQGNSTEAPPTCARNYSNESKMTLLNKQILKMLFADKSVISEQNRKGLDKTKTKRLDELADAVNTHTIATQPCTHFLERYLSSVTTLRHQDFVRICGALRDTTWQDIVADDFNWAAPLAPSKAFQIMGPYTASLLEKVAEPLSCSNLYGNKSRSCPGACIPDGLTKPRLTFTILGPTSSDVLHEFRREAADDSPQICPGLLDHEPKKPAVRRPLPCHRNREAVTSDPRVQDIAVTQANSVPSPTCRFEIISPQASAAQLLGYEPAEQNHLEILYGDRGNLEPFRPNYSQAGLALKALGIGFSTTALSDSRLAGELLKELAERGYNKNRHRVVFVGEWDTYYGRSLKETFSETFFDEQLSDRFFYTYMRGIDGEGRVMQKYSPGNESSLRSTNGNPTYGFMDQVQPASFDQSLGDDQIDYLRRIASDIEFHDMKLRTEESRSIWGIGLIGSDVYDKILIMRALRDRFPQAVFFTTELDARFSDRGAQDGHTRNLVVASSYGLELGQACQGPVPAFRGWAQTSFFLAVQRAVGGPCRSAPNLAPGKEPRFINYQPDTDAKVFEIGRTRAHFFSDSTEEECPEPELNEAARQEQLSSRSCYNPPPSNLAVKLSPRSLLCVFVIAVITSILLVGACCAGLQRNEIYPSIAYVFVSFLLGSIILYVAHQSEEPIAWSEGISIWPTELIRFLAFLVGILFLSRNGLSGSLFLRRNTQDI